MVGNLPDFSQSKRPESIGSAPAAGQLKLPYYVVSEGYHVASGKLNRWCFQPGITDVKAQVRAVGVLARAVHPGHQEQAAEEPARLDRQPHRRRPDQLLRAGQEFLDAPRLPLHALGQRRLRAEHPHDVVAFADLPQSGARHGAGNDDGGDIADRCRTVLGERRGGCGTAGQDRKGQGANRGGTHAGLSFRGKPFRP